MGYNLKVKIKCVQIALVTSNRNKSGLNQKMKVLAYVSDVQDVGSGGSNDVTGLRPLLSLLAACSCVTDIFHIVFFPVSP